MSRAETMQKLVATVDSLSEQNQTLVLQYAKYTQKLSSIQTAHKNLLDNKPGTYYADRVDNTMHTALLIILEVLEEVIEQLHKDA